MIPDLLHALTGTLAGRTLIGYLAVFVVPVMLPPLFIRVVGLGGLRDVLSYEPSESPLHRLDPRIKLLWLLVLGTTSVVLGWQAELAVLALTMAGWAVVAPSARRLQVLLAMSFAPAVGLVWSQALFHPAVTPAGQPVVDFAFPPTISWLGAPGISISGLVYGAEQACRTLVTISAALLLVLTTSPSDIVWAFRKFRMPVRWGFALTAALRFLPDLIGRLSVLLKAVQARGLDLHRPGLAEWRAWPGYLRRAAACVPIVTVPLLIGALRGTATMAMVADARAFGASSRPTVLDDRTGSRADLIAGAALGLFLMAVAALTVMHTGLRTVAP